MNIQRTLKHLLSWRPAFKQRFSAEVLQAITQACAAAENLCAAEIVFMAEERLPLSYLRRNASARSRAITLFGKHRVWDTAHNVGVLIYVQWADRKVEIVADRGVAGAATQDQWNAWCAVLAVAFKTDSPAAALCACLAEMAATLGQALPATVASKAVDEISNQARVV